MKKMILTFIFHLLFLQFLFSSGISYEPKHILQGIEKLLEKNIVTYDISNINEIFPIGWSKDGKFAYIEYKEAAGKPTIAYKLIIQDLVTDEIVWNSGFFDVFDLYNEYYDMGKEDDFPDYNVDSESPEFFYQYKKEEINKNLFKYKIVQSEQIVTNFFPSKIKGYVLNALINILKLGNEMYTTKDDVNYYDYYSFNIEIFNSDKGSKIIHSEEIVDDWMFGSQIIGYIKSPFEDRIAVIISYYYWDYSGGNHLDFKLVGCDLNFGFK